MNETERREEAGMPDGGSSGVDEGVIMPDREEVVDDHREMLLGSAQTLRSGANWFYWIAGLSIVNTGLMLAGSETTFVLGLATTLFVDGFGIGLAQELGNMGLFIALGIDLVIYAMVIGTGYLAGRGNRPVLVIGMVLYAFDGVIYLAVGEFLGVGIHVFALFFMVKALQALNTIRAAESGALA